MERHAHVLPRVHRKTSCLRYEQSIQNVPKCGAHLEPREQYECLEKEKAATSAAEY